MLIISKNKKKIEPVFKACTNIHSVVIVVKINQQILIFSPNLFLKSCYQKITNN
jgi:hypothetical protein